MSKESDLLGRLHDLQGLSRKKHFQFSKPEQEEALSVLSELCTTDQEDYENLIEALAEFPSEVGAQILSMHWEKLLKANFSVIRDLQTTAFDSDPGKRLRISLAHRLIDIDPESALELLYASFKKMKPSKGSIPTVKDLSIIRNALIQPGHQSLEKLPLQEKTQATLIINYILAAAFTHNKSNKQLPAQVQTALLQWANRFQKVPPLPREIHTAIEHSIKTWDQNSLTSLAQSIESFQPTIRDTLVPVFRKGATDTTLSTSQALVSPSTPSFSSSPPPPPQIQPYDPLKEIENIGQYIRNIKSQIEQTKRELSQANVDLQQIRKDLQSARNECGNAQRQMASIQQSNVRLSQEKEDLQREIEAIKADKEKLSEELTSVRGNHEQAVAAHSEHLDTLSERIESEGKHQIGLFRNRMGAKVQKYINDFNEASSMEMTADLGEALRNQMKQLFQILKDEGIKIDGGA